MIDKTLQGISGEYFVAGELSRLGYIASLTLKNTKGVDILVTDNNGKKHALIQVKTTKHKDWLLSKKAENFVGFTLYYVFVKLDTGGNPIKYYIVPSNDVANYVTKSHRKWLETPGKQGQKHNDSTMRTFCIDEDDEKYLNRWSNLRLD